MSRCLCMTWGPWASWSAYPSTSSRTTTYRQGGINYLNFIIGEKKTLITYDPDVLNIYIFYKIIPWSKVTFIFVLILVFNQYLLFNIEYSQYYVNWKKNYLLFKVTQVESWEKKTWILTGSTAGDIRFNKIYNLLIST